MVRPLLTVPATLYNHPVSCQVRGNPLSPCGHFHTRSPLRISRKLGCASFPHVSKLVSQHTEAYGWVARFVCYFSGLLLPACYILLC